MKKTKSALLLSMLSVLLCAAMLISTTLAWFTDSASTGVNRIQAGNLSVDLIMDKEENGTYVSIKNSTGDIFSEAAGNGINWEPGRTEIVYLGVKSLGSLAIKYNIQLNITDNGLADALEYAIIDGAKASDLAAVTDWTTLKAAAGGQTGELPTGQVIAAPNGRITDATPDKTDYFALAIHMKESAGNEFNSTEKHVIIDMSVTATQATYESDSFGPNYDEDAAIPTAINTAAELSSAIADTAEGGTAFLACELDLGHTNLTVDKNITLAFAEGSVIKNGTIKIAKDKDVAFENLKLEGVTSVYAVDNGTVRFKDSHFAVTPKTGIANNSRGTVLLGENQYKTLNIDIDNCVFDYVYDSSVANGDLYTTAIFTWSSVKECSIRNSTFNGYGFAAVKLMNVAADANILFEGNTFNMCDASAPNNYYNNAIQFIPQHDNACTVTVRNNVFTGAYEENKYVFYSEKMSSGGASLANMTLVHSGNTINGVACTDDNFRK